MQSSIWWGLFEWLSPAWLLCFVLRTLQEKGPSLFFSRWDVWSPVFRWAEMHLKLSPVGVFFASEPLDSTFCGGGENRTIRHSAITGAYSLSVEPQFSWASEPRWQKAVAAMQEAEESRVSCEFKTLRRMRLYLQILCTYIYYIHINGCFLKWYPKTIASPHQSR